MLLVRSYNYIFHTDTVDMPLKIKFITTEDAFGTWSLCFLLHLILLDLSLYLQMLIPGNLKARLEGQKQLQFFFKAELGVGPVTQVTTLLSVGALLTALPGSLVYG